jgi:hypothetical protein
MKRKHRKAVQATKGHLRVRTRVKAGFRNG